METYREMSSLLVVVKSHLFPQVDHLNRERGKVAAVTVLAIGTGELKMKRIES